MTGSGKLPRQLMLCAAFSAALTVGLGAYGAHGLEVSDALLRMWETAVSYQMWHALAALAVGTLMMFLVGRARTVALVAGWLVLVGSWGFSFSLYYFVEKGIIPIPGLAPLGGMAMIAGWVMLGISILIQSKTSDNTG